ncbi:MAG: CDP-alcohol phosphatidyltransferase family protein [Erythrobacter sp.]
MTNHPIVFQSAAVANTLIAGVPCAVRTILATSQAGIIDLDQEVLLLVKGKWHDFEAVHRDLGRIVPEAQMEWESIDSGTVDPAVRAIDGLECLRDPENVIPRNLAELLLDDHFQNSVSTSQILVQASCRTIANTGKTTDGIVSRYINRPISQFISFQLLKSPGMRPIHATIAAGLIGVVMALCLFLGGHAGLLWGAVLFQFASVIDGVDGEIARATFRSSKLGATLDTAGDVATNFAFIAGVSFNLWMSGNVAAGQAGFAGLALLITGLTVLGFLSIRGGGALSFDALKHDARRTASPVMVALSTIASRDVYALFLAVLILVGWAAPAMIFFAMAVTIWFFVAAIMLGRRFFWSK